MTEATTHHPAIAWQAGARPTPASTPWWGRARVLAGAWLCLLVYGSLMPFNFAVDEQLAAHGGSVLSLLWGCLTSLGFVDPTLHRPTSSLGLYNTTSDVLLNALLYLPLGLFLRLALRRPGVKQTLITSGLLPTVLALALLSYAMECTQSLMPGRWPTVTDWVTNVGGGVAGALVGPWLARHGRALVFWVYCRSAAIRFKVEDVVRIQRKRPVVMFLAVAVNCGLILLWYMTSLRDQNTPREALPFMGLFHRSYDVAMVLLGRSVVVYVLVAMLLSLQFLRQQARRGFSIIVLGVALLAVVLEFARYAGSGGRVVTDLTEPIVAAMAAAALVFTFYLLFHAVRCSCRRQEQMPVQVERRRRRHDYGKTPRATERPRPSTQTAGATPSRGGGTGRARPAGARLSPRRGPRPRSVTPRPAPHRRLSPQSPGPPSPARARSPYQRRLCSRRRAGARP